MDEQSEQRPVFSEPEYFKHPSVRLQPLIVQGGQHDDAADDLPGRYQRFCVSCLYDGAPGRRRQRRAKLRQDDHVQRPARYANDRRPSRSRDPGLRDRPWHVLPALVQPHPELERSSADASGQRLYAHGVYLGERKRHEHS